MPSQSVSDAAAISLAVRSLQGWRALGVLDRKERVRIAGERIDEDLLVRPGPFEHDRTDRQAEDGQQGQRNPDQGRRPRPFVPARLPPPVQPAQGRALPAPHPLQFPLQGGRAVDIVELVPDDVIRQGRQRQNWRAGRNRQRVGPVGFTGDLGPDPGWNTILAERTSSGVLANRPQPGK